jgi:hypothetical protein
MVRRCRLAAPRTVPGHFPLAGIASLPVPDCVVAPRPLPYESIVQRFCIQPKPKAEWQGGADMGRCQTKNRSKVTGVLFGGEGGIRTLAGTCAPLSI